MSNIRDKSIKLNVVFSYVLKLINVIVSFVLISFMIRNINTNLYGIWLTILSVVSWFNVFDIGIGHGLRNKIVEQKVYGNNAEIKKYLSTAYALMFFVFICIYIIFFFVSEMLDFVSIFNAVNINQVDLKNGLRIIVGLFCIQMVAKLINFVVLADFMPALSSFIDVMGQVLVLLLLYVTFFFKLKYNFVLLGVIYFFPPVIVLLLASVLLYFTKYRSIRPSLKLINIKYVNGIGKLGFQFFIIQICVVVLLNSNSIIIAHVAGAEAVVLYNIVYKYLGLIYMLINIYYLPYWSAYTEAYVRGDGKWMNNKLKQLEVIASGAVFLTFILFFISDKVYTLWLGSKYHIDLMLSIFIAVYFSINIYKNLYMCVLNGLGKIRMQMVMSVLFSFMHVFMAIYLGKIYGLLGVMFVSITMSVLSMLYAPIQVKMILNNKAKGIWAM